MATYFLSFEDNSHTQQTHAENLEDFHEVAMSRDGCAPAKVLTLTLQFWASGNAPLLVERASLNQGHVQRHSGSRIKSQCS